MKKEEEVVRRRDGKAILKSGQRWTALTSRKKSFEEE